MYLAIDEYCRQSDVTLPVLDTMGADESEDLDAAELKELEALRAAKEAANAAGVTEQNEAAVQIQALLRSRNARQTRNGQRAAERAEQKRREQVRAQLDVAVHGARTLGSGPIHACERGPCNATVRVHLRDGVVCVRV